MGIGFVKLTSAGVCGNTVFKMNTDSVLLSPVLQWFCDFLKQSSTYDDLFLSMLIFAHCSWNFVADAPAKCAPTIFPLPKSEKSPIFRFFHADYQLTQ
jgi:hypothetical protein